MHLVSLRGGWLHPPALVYPNFDAYFGLETVVLFTNCTDDLAKMCFSKCIHYVSCNP